MKKTALFVFKNTVSLIVLILFSLQVLAEGTKEIRPASGDHGYVLLDPNWSNFALYNCADESRLRITICNPNEIIYYGFRQTQGDVRFRIRNQAGTIVVPETFVPTSGAGYISTYARAVAGPSAIVGGTGYNARSYVAPTPGDYYIEFRLPSGGPRRDFEYFDITVASPANVAIPGRVWSKAWMFSTRGPDNTYANEFKGKLFIYADDGIVTSLDFNGMQPYAFVLVANNTGTSNTGNAAFDRQSKRGKVTYAQYKVFLNDPDESCYPTGQFGNITQPTTITGCPPANFCINVFVDRPGRAEVLLDLNGVPGYQAGTADRILSQDVVPPSACISWDGTDGLGNFVTTGLTITTDIEFYNGLTHIPLYDVERNPNGYIVELVRPVTGNPIKLYWDDSLIPAPGAGTNLTGCISPCHTWTWNCCSNRANDYGNTNTINTWWYADSTKSITTNLVPPGVLVDADTRRPGGNGSGNDTTICGNMTTYGLSGNVINAGGGQWSTSGTGTFSPNNTTMNATYNISAADRASGSVTLTLTSTGSGICPSAQDNLTLTFQTPPTATAGPPATVCANNPAVALAGSFTDAGGAIWSTSGSGTFSPANTNLNATYTPSAADTTAGTVTLTLTTTGNNKCSAATSDKIITIQDAPFVNAGPNQTVCANNPAITLAGTAAAATSQTWSGGTGTYNPNNTTLGAVYTPSAAEINAGTVTLTLTAGRAGCNNVQDLVTFTISNAPTANAGPDQSVCHNNPNVTLAGAVTNATSRSWSGGGGTFNPDNNTLNAVYTPTLAERNSGTVTLTLTASRAGCTDVSDPMTITITPSPVANAGNDEVVCANNPTIAISSASVTGATGGTWTGVGGSFVPNANTVNPTYTLSAGEVSFGFTSLILTTTGNGNCQPVSDTMQILVLPSPLPDAGPDQTVCHNNSVVNLSGSALNSSSVLWSGGTGAFSATNILNPTYTPTLAERNLGSVTLTLTASEFNCNPVNDQITITIDPAPTANAGADQSVCHNNPNVTLNGSVSNATSQTWSGGAGTFSPNANAVNAVYTPTLAERNNGTVILTLTASSPGCADVTDNMTITITPAPTVDANSNQSVCTNNPNVVLAGVSSTGEGIWSGGGTFNNASTLNATYTPSAGEIALGTATLTLTTANNGNCNPVSDQMTVTITPAPVPNAGPDQTVCADAPSITLAGSTTVATGGSWTGGAGTYNPNSNTFNAIYTPTVAEINTGTITLTLTTTGNGNCNPVSDQVTFTITPAPTVSAGTDQTVCGAATTVSLAGTVTGSTGGQWTTSGTGSFSPNANTLNATYNTSAADRASPSVTLTLTTTGNGVCNAISDVMVINFTEVPSINAGADQTVCTNDFPVQLNGSGSPATWSGGSGSFSPNANTLNATYTPSAGEATAQTVTLTLTTIANGACPVVSDQVTITIPAGPVANAGADQTMCGNLASFTLNGTITNAAGGFWSSSGTGSFSPDANTLNAAYIPSALDRANGSVTLTLSTTGNGFCTGHSDQMVLTITPAIVVNAGPDQTVCADLAGFTLNGASVTNAGGGTWSAVSGTGTFSPNNNTILATYSPSAADRLAGSVTLRLTSTGNGGCAAISDDVTYTITPAPTVNAGPDQTVCADLASVALDGSFTIAGGVQWSTSGTGVFSPSSTSEDPTYTPSPADKTAGSVTLTITTTGNGICNAVTDQMTITITPAPTINAGSDRTVCADVGSVTLNGSVTIATGGTWTTSGSGTFVPDANTLNATYTLSAGDISNGLAVLTLTSTGNGTCNSVNDQMVITITPAPTVTAGADRNVCANNPSLTLNATVTVSTGGVWTGGNGTFSPNNTDLSAVYTPSAAEIANGTVTLTITTTGNGTCNAVDDQMTITITDPPTADAGPDQTICADSISVSLNGSFTVATGGAWSTSGTGTFFPGSATANAIYAPSATDRTNGSVTLTFTTTGNGTCNAVNDQMTITITPAPTVNAGANQTVCANNSTVSLSGSVTVASGGTWTTSGTGTFANANALSTTYTPSALDNLAGTVTLTLNTTGSGSCREISDQLTLTINPAPTVNAGPDQSVCANNPAVTLNGSYTIAGGAIWTTSGTGTFSPDATTLNATYNPSAADTAAGTVTLTLTTTGNGLCNAVNDQVTITITDAPTVNAGPDQTVCADVLGVNLNGIKTVAAGGIWTSNGTGVFSPNATTLNATYRPSTADTAAGTVTLMLTTTGNGNCNAVDDLMTITITKVPIVNAGPDTTLCADIEYLNLVGTITNATGGNWTSSGNGLFSPDATTLNGQYFPSGDDFAGNSFTLTLTSTGHGTCNPVSDQRIVTVNPVPTVNAGSDQTVCANNPDVTLSGSVTIATGGTWVSSGDGTFTPDANTLNAVYTPSSDDITGGSVALTLHTIGNGACNSVSDQMIITITPAPTADAGSNQSVCANNPAVTLNGSISVATAASWTTSGTGTFAPSATALNATYTPSNTDTTAGTVTLTLTTTANGNCNAVNDFMTVTITDAPAVNAGVDQTVCANNPVTTLNGSVFVATGGTWTTGSGTGTFAPDANTLNATFTPSAAQIANGQAVLTLTTTGNGNCNSRTDQITITITPAPTVNAGSDQTVCANNRVVTLTGAVTVATGGTWTSSGTGVFADPNALNTTYTPSDADTTAGTVTLTLTTTGNGTCSQVTDQMVVTITDAPVVNAGADQSVCANNSAVTLNGSVHVATGAVWSTSGTGTFSPNTSTLNASYTPSAADTTAGSVTLTLTSTDAGNCSVVNDAMVVTITDAPSVNTGPAQNVCANTAGVSLNGSVFVATGGTWSTGSGTGTFVPDANTLNAIFIPSASQIANGQANLTLTTTGNGNCAVVSRNLVITLHRVPSVNAGSDVQVCAGTPSIGLSGTVTNATGGTWSGGAGTFSNANVLNPTYTPDPAENFDPNVITLTLTSTGNGPCPAATDQMTISFTTIPVDAGPDQTVCSNSFPVQLSGSGNGTWSGGAGTFSDPNSLSTTYTPDPAEVPGVITLTLTGIAVGACTPGVDQVDITLIEGPTADAGSDQSLCANNATVTLAGGFTNATGLTWDTEGTGVFDGAFTTYTPSAADIATGSVKLSATTFGHVPCNAASDTMIVTFTPAPVVNAGANQAVCSNGGAIPLNGSASAGTATWSLSTNAGGSFDNPAVLNTNYNYIPADTLAGTITLRLTSNLAGCALVHDEMDISFGASPTANAGNDVNVCRNNANTPLNGIITVAGGGVWSTSGTGSFSPNANALNATYIPAPADTALASVTLTLTSTGNGTCNAVADTKVLTFTTSPSVEAGPPQSVCANNSVVTLNGTVNIATGGTWTSSGTGTFANANTLNTTYTPSAADSADGNVLLTLTTNAGAPTCSAVSDQVTITITPAPVVNAGANQAVCANGGPIALSGTVSGAPGGVWSIVTGTGAFGDPNNLNTTYTPSNADTTAGFVRLRLTTSFGNCADVSDELDINFGSAPTADAGGPQTICADASEVNLNGAVTVAAGGQWSTSGSGTFSPNTNTLNAVYVPSAADTTAGTVTLTLTTTGNGTCNAVSDPMTLTITDAPTVDAGVNQTVCGDIISTPISGTITTATGAQWTTSGTGTFGNANNLSTTYTPSAADKSAGNVTLTLTTTAGLGTCNAVSDVMSVIITPAPTVNAGLDQTACNDVISYTLNPTVTVATGGTWSTSGSGVFGDPNAFNTTYTPSTADTTAGSVTLTLTTTTGLGTCNAVNDQLVLTFTDAPAVNAGSDRTICADKDTIRLSGLVSVASGGTWTTSGTGTFSPNATVLNPAYNFSAADTAAGSVTLTLTSTGNGTCNSRADNILITIDPKPVVNAGSDQTICAGQTNATMNGIVHNAGGGIWTSTGTGTFTDDTDLGTTYNPSAADNLLGGMIITLTSTGNGTCNAVSDFIVVNVIPAPSAVVNAGFNQTVCRDVIDVQLNGFISNAGGGMWTSPGTGTFFPDDQTLDAIYRPSAADKALPSITLSLTTTNNGLCSPVTDQMTITFTPTPTADAGPATTNICGDLAGTATLNGAVTVATGGIWSSSGTGVFSPDAATLNATYTPSAQDRANGVVGLTLTTTGNGTCNAVNDVITVTITRPPTINAGTDKIVCADVATVNISASTTVATGGTWATSGTGTFGNPNALVTTYIPTTADTSAGMVNLTVTSTGNGTCTPVTDQVRITFNNAPIANAGPDQTMCAETSITLINGTVANAAGGTWTTSGSGSFSDANALTATYTPSQTDKNAGLVTLTLTTTGNGVCTPAADPIDIVIEPKPIVDAGSALVCALSAGAPLSGTVTHATGGMWSSSGSGVFAPNASVTNATYYPSAADAALGSVTLTLTSTGNGTCTPVTHSTVLSIDPLPIANAGQDQYICRGSATTLNAQTSPDVTYTWSTMTGNPIGSSPVLSVTANSDTSFVLTVTDAKTCSVSDTVNVGVYDLPTFNLTDNNCLSDTLLLDSDPAGLPAVPGVFQWYKNGNIMTGENRSILSLTDIGNYTVTYSYGNCSISDVTTVTRPPVLRTMKVLHCENASTAITITSTPSNVSYNWPTEGQSGMGLSTINITVPADTSYVPAIVTDAVGCSSTDSVFVIGIPTPLLTLDSLASCQGRTEILDGRPDNIVNLDAFNPVWQWKRNTAILANTNDSLPVSTPGTYSVRLTLGQCISRDTSVVIFNPNPSAALPDKLKFCKETDNLVILDGGAGTGYTYLWSTSTGTLDSINTQTTAVRNEGTYTVTVTNSFNCPTIDSVFLDDICPPRLYVPNAIIPGTTGGNQVFKVFGDYFVNYKMTVFNRWGEVIFMSTDREMGWDGTYRGAPMPVGVYPWIITYEGEDPDLKGPYQEKGTVTIIR